MSVLDENYNTPPSWSLHRHMISESSRESRFPITWLKMVLVVMYRLN